MSDEFGARFTKLASAEQALPAEVVLTVLRTARLLNEQLEPQFKAHGLTPSTFTTLLVLFEHDEPLPPKAISDRMRIPAQTLTSLLDGLERRALVAREPNPRDRRSVLVRLTDDGRAALLAAARAFAPAEAELLAEVSPADQRTLVELLAQVQAACVAARGAAEPVAAAERPARPARTRQ